MLLIKQIELPYIELLKNLRENDIVHQIDDGTGITKYALCEEGCSCDIKTDLHLHFHCNICE